MSSEQLGVVMLVTFVLLIFTGFPLFAIFLSVAIVFGLIGWGPQCLPLFMNSIYGVMDNYILLAIPLFIIMAAFLNKAGVAERLFNTTRYLFGPVAGGVGITVTAACTLFGACVGIVGASVTPMALIALPVMLKFGYDKSFSTGIVTSSGCLGIIIPPSVMLIIMSDQAGVSVGKAFIGAIFPGLILSALFMCYILARSIKNPSIAPPMPLEERVEMTSKPIGLKVRMIITNLLPILALIGGVLGSIMAGIATPTEASGVGAFIAFLLLIIYRGFKWEAIREALVSALKISCFVMVLVTAAACFAAVFVGLGSASLISVFIAELGNRWLVLAVIMVIFLILGMTMDYIAIVFITFPIFLPLLELFGFDVLWWIILACINLTMGYITPPFGYALFYTKGVAPPEIEYGDIYRGVLPFIGLFLVGLSICILFPEVILWLPSVLIK